MIWMSHFQAAIGVYHYIAVRLSDVSKLMAQKVLALRRSRRIPVAAKEDVSPDRDRPGIKARGGQCRVVVCVQA
jgi:hypothetical protein